jgi:aspartate racemase
MKTIGLIGGMSWESSTEYYRIINEEVKRRLGGFHSAKCILYSVDFEEIELCQRNGEWGKTARILSDAARSLKAAGADFVILCTNTMHKVAEQIEAGRVFLCCTLPISQPGRFYLMGLKPSVCWEQKYTMEQDFYKSRLESQGIKVLIPNEGDRAIVNAVIYDELCLGQIIDGSRDEYKRIIRELIEQGAEGIILGCTEIGLLVKPEDSDVPLFDTTLIHAVGAVDYAL